jgi:hypothetical protein
MTFEIEKNTPIPLKKITGRPKSKARLSLEALSVGDSVFFPNSYFSGSARPFISVSSFANRVLGSGNYACRKTEKNGIDGHRVWRTA